MRKAAKIEREIQSLLVGVDPITALLVYHHEKGCLDEDYYGVSVWTDGKCLTTYGDEYHEKGATRARGYIDALIHKGFVVSMVYKQTDVFLQDDIPDSYCKQSGPVGGSNG